ncbi:MAG: histidine--tRNA ligase [Candidatus Omnitrophota bacterium]
MLKALRGTRDILPQEAALWQRVEAAARDIFAIYDYKEIRTPVIEEASLFIRSIGNATDIVQKEMYAFTDRGGRAISLRPEATASIVRAYIENSIYNKESLSKLFYIGPMFRSERPQKGRQRQFYQLGVEAIGSDSPFLDAEVIALSVRFLEKIGIKKIELKINSLGCQEDKIKLIKEHRKNIKPHLSSLCEECKARFDKNVLRVFDCKNPECKKIVSGLIAPDHLCDSCASHFEELKKALKSLGLDFIIDKRIVRGLDYYTKTVFEVTQEDLGAKDAICAGGRYNDLIKDMGGKPTPAIGFAFGMERIVLAMKEADKSPESTLDFFIVNAGEVLQGKTFELLMKLRDSNISQEKKISYEIEYEKKNLKSQMKSAQKKGAKFVIILGEDEIRRGKVVFKDMSSGDQEEADYNIGSILQKAAFIKEKDL